MHALQLRWHCTLSILYYPHDKILYYQAIKIFNAVFFVDKLTNFLSKLVCGLDGETASGIVAWSLCTQRQPVYTETACVHRDKPGN